MFYNISMVFNKILRAYKFYIWIILQIAICLSLIIVGISDLNILERKKSIILNSHENEEYLIQKNTMKSFVGPTIFEDSFKKVFEYSENQTKNLSIVSVDTLLATDFKKNNKYATTVLFCNSFIPREFLGVPEPKENTLYLNQAKYNEIEKFFNNNSPNGNFIRKNGNYYYKNIKYKIEIIKFEKEISVGDISHELLANKNSVFIFSSDYKDFESSITVHTKYYEGEENAYDFFEKLKSYAKTPENLSINSVYVKFTNAIEPLIARLQMKYYAGFLAFISIVFGSGGLFIVFLERRKKEYAINFMLGARFKNIKNQLYAEIFLVFFTGFILAIPFSFLMPKHKFNSFYKFEFSSFSFLLALAIVISVPFFITSLSGVNQKDIQRLK